MLEQEYRNNTQKTISWYDEKLRDFFSWLGSDNATDLTLQNFKKYGIFLRSQKKANGDKLSGSSVQGALRVNCMDNKRLSLRNKCFVALMLDSGLRRGEVPKLNIGDVDFRNKTLLVKGKGYKQRIVPLGSMSCSLLQRYFDECRSKEFVSSSAPFFLDFNGNRCSDNLMKQVFQDLKKASGIERLHPHLLRHTFATYYLADGGDLETLRLILGHADIQTTQSYLHLAFNLKLTRSRHNSHLDKLDLDV